MAVAGWALASYDSKLLVLTLPDIKKDLGLSDSAVGLLGFFVYGAQFLITLFIGYAMDRRGRKVMSMNIAWLSVGVVVGCLQGIATFFPAIGPGQELESIAT